MFSLIFFGFVGLILIVGFIIVMLRHRKARIKKQVDEEAAYTRDRERISKPSPFQNALREEPNEQPRGRIVPTDTKRPPTDLGEEG